MSGVVTQSVCSCSRVRARFSCSAETFVCPTNYSLLCVCKYLPPPPPRSHPIGCIRIADILRVLVREE